MSEKAAPPVPAPPAGTESNIFASIDFAHFAAQRLLVYGWILGFPHRLESASLQIGEREIDLADSAKTINRPDVSQHFSVSGEGHGFYVLIDLHLPAEVDFVRLIVSLPSGETQDSRWKIERHDPLLASMPASHLATLRALLRMLPPLDRFRLTRFLPEGSITPEEAALPTVLPPSVQFQIDSCCVLEERILVVYGWLLDPTEETIQVNVGIGNDEFDLHNAAIPIPRMEIQSDAAHYRRRESSRPAGFVLVQVIQAATPAQTEAPFAVIANGAQVAYLIRPICWNTQESRNKLLLLLGDLDLESGMLLMERILSATQALPGMQSLRELLQSNHDRAVKRLPASIHNSSRRCRYWLHVDHVIPVASKGIFLSGWCYAENAKPFDVVYHCGEFSFALNANWIRHTRTDVTTYLQTEGAQVLDDEHGFTCYVPLNTGDRPPWLSTASEYGDERRMHIPASEHEKSALQTVRSILATFHGEHRELRSLLERQVGPAVEAVWAARPKTVGRAFVTRFGVRKPNPEVSIIVPLYGRWDFAEYQLSQFANDPDFQNYDLIYVVDDPTIYDGFRLAAPLLFGIYQIPFTVAFSGANLGFAGANNFGVGYAQGKFILLLNSDVLPKGPGWLRELVRIHATLQDPGLLGVRLLYEDGTLQHAGIAFRRYAPWGDMWINDHPGKGQIPTGLHGTREVSAVTAACVLLEATLYRELKGLSEDYIIGDFEDSDLCWRAKQAGRRNYIALDVELYHFERQSQGHTGDALWRSNLTAYNCWLHNKRWSALIESQGEEQF